MAWKTLGTQPCRAPLLWARGLPSASGTPQALSAFELLQVLVPLPETLLHPCLGQQVPAPLQVSPSGGLWESFLSSWFTSSPLARHLVLRPYFESQPEVTFTGHLWFASLPRM